MSKDPIAPIKQKIYKYYDWILQTKPSPSEIEQRFLETKIELDTDARKYNCSGLEDLFKDMYFRNFTSNHKIQGTINFELYEIDSVKDSSAEIWGKKADYKVTHLKNNHIRTIEDYCERNITYATSWFFNGEIVQNIDYYRMIASEKFGWVELHEPNNIIPDESTLYNQLLYQEYQPFIKDENALVEEFIKRSLKSAELHEFCHKSRNRNVQSFDEEVNEEKLAILTEMRYGDDQYYALARLFTYQNKPTDKATQKILEYFIDTIHENPEIYKQIDQSDIKDIYKDFGKIVLQMHKLSRNDIKSISEEMYLANV
ncbi:MAG: hypothetical protein U9R34_02245 [Nanoarchaeota archaeon]|nr:hypothetical protein [Nanoarchaeota archaeon]